MPKKKVEAPAEMPEKRAPAVQAQAAPEEDKAAKTAPKGCPAVVRAPKGLNLRIGPALNYEVLEVLPDGAEVTAMDMPAWAEVPGWRLVCAQNGAPAGAQRSGSGEFGWVQSRFLRLLED